MNIQGWYRGLAVGVHDVVDACDISMLVLYCTFIQCAINRATVVQHHAFHFPCQLLCPFGSPCFGCCAVVGYTVYTMLHTKHDAQFGIFRSVLTAMLKCAYQSISLYNSKCSFNAGFNAAFFKCHAQIMVDIDNIIPTQDNDYRNVHDKCPKGVKCLQWRHF